MEDKHGFSYMQSDEYRRVMKQANGKPWVDMFCVCILALAFVVISLGWLG